MSRQHEYERSTRRTVNSIAGPRRSGLGHWIPLGLTILVATAGIAAWIWSERRDDDDDEAEQGRDGSQTPRDERDAISLTMDTTTQYEESSSYMARMSGALRRTPSPQQFIDGASRTVSAGVAAAGAAVGNALSSIREEDKNAYKDHKTWAEEVKSRALDVRTDATGTVSRSQENSDASHKTASQPNRHRKTVAVVLSAEARSDDYDEEEDFHHENASILSHLPTTIDFSSIKLFVLIYAPVLKHYPSGIQDSRARGSLDSSFAYIGSDQAQSPQDEGTKLSSQTSSASPFQNLWAQAQAIVEKDTMVLPFTTPTGYMHLLRHLNPEYVYLQESLAGPNGDTITHLQTWLRQDVILVVGAEGGHGGLADSESEVDQSEKEECWWEKEERVGRGRGVVVVEGIRVGDDWARRMNQDTF